MHFELCSPTNSHNNSCSPQILNPYTIIRNPV